MENLWGPTVRLVYKCANSRQFSTIDELRTAVMGAWRTLTLQSSRT
ncbi:unnamed protein product [Haemonchus placei]|uniref:Transposase n=1 Tax=Haemonchus placei TaxID=6290 RepID=A0A0N4WM77_HAEPC|nr:unnamed protein product [Haemonchus placei]